MRLFQFLILEHHLIIIQLWRELESFLSKSETSTIQSLGIDEQALLLIGLGIALGVPLVSLIQSHLLTQENLENVFAYVEPSLRYIIYRIRSPFEDPFLLYNPSSIDLLEHVRECTLIKLELDRRFLGLAPQLYLHRSIRSLEALETYMYQQLGHRPVGDIIRLVQYYGITNQEASLLTPDSVYGFAPTVRILASRLQEIGLSRDLLPGLFSTNAHTIDAIISTNDILISGMF